MEKESLDIMKSIIINIINIQPDSVIKFAAIAVKEKNFAEKDVIAFVNTVCSQQKDNPELMEKMIGKENTKSILFYAQQKAVEQDFVVMNKCIEEDMSSINVKCPHCGSTSFTITEQLVWKGEVDEDNSNMINCYHKTSGIQEITCNKCKKDITELDNDKVTFNFQ